jgi:hypothetical protein
MSKRKGNRENKKTKKPSDGAKKKEKDPKRYEGLGTHQSVAILKLISRGK